MERRRWWLIDWLIDWLIKYAARLHCYRIHYHPANILWRIHRIQKNRFKILDYQNLIKQFWRILQAMMWLSRNRIKHDTEQTEGTTPANTILLRGAITREYAYTGVRHFTSNFIQQLHNHSGYFTRHRPLHYHLSKTMVYPHQTRKGAGSRVVTLTSFLMNSRPHLVYARMGRTTSTQHSLDGYGFFFF